MLLDAAREFEIDLGASVMIGDKASDVGAGRAAGVGRCWLVHSGHALGAQALREADAVHADLLACTDALLGTTR
jgi:D-glycero-D-manno-heptose 1,7-bisphosphate phosphatase